MKKLFFTLCMIACFFASQSQTASNTSTKQKLLQISVRGGLDKATKSNFSNYTTKDLKGFNIGASIDKYWDWYGLGLDIDYLKNSKPEYIDSNGLANLLFASGYTNTQFSAAVSNQTDLSRIFIGVGPSLKAQTKNNKFVAELNLRAGITSTKGSSIQYSTQCTVPSASAAIIAGVQRDGDASGVQNTWGTFYHKGYDNKVLGTFKAQARLNYYVSSNIAISLSGYYMLYFNSDADYNYLDWKNGFATSTPYQFLKPMLAKTKLSSAGASIGVSYGMFSNTATTTLKKAKNNLTVAVKDELTGQPIVGAIVTITNANGKTYSSITGTDGNAKFTKVEDGNYKITGMLNDMATTEQNEMLGTTNRNASTSLIHNDPRFTVQGKAVNLTKNQPESDVIVTLKNNSKGAVKMATSQSGTGQFSFQLETNSDYEMVGRKASYISNIEKISTKGLTRSQTLYVQLELGVQQVEIGKPVPLQNIYYDLDKANISEDASTDLKKVVQFMIDNPTMSIEISSHTDARGSDEYNLKLSQDRADAVVKYLDNNGINKAKLKAKGYGETMLINKCANGVECTEAEHKANRRTELVAVSL